LYICVFPACPRILSWGSTGQASQKRIGQLQEDHPDYQREKRREREREGERERASPIREKKETQ